MSGYFGNGYFLRVLQRGAAPVAKPQSRPTQTPVRFEETVTTGGDQSSDVPNQTFEAQNDSLDHPVTTPTAMEPPKDDPFVEPQSVEAAVATRFDSHETTLPAASTGQVPEAVDTRNPEPDITFRSNDSLDLGESSSTALVSSDLSPGPPVPPAKNSLESRSGNRVFELKMPEHFFGHAKNETSPISHTRPASPPRIVAPAHDPKSESGSAVDHSSEVVPVQVHAEAQSHLESAIIPKRSDELRELQTIEVSQHGSAAEAQVTPQSTRLVNEIVSHVVQSNAQPSRLIAAEAFESSAPTPRAEQSSEYLQLRQPSITPAPVVPPARLQINRLDIQVINQVAAPLPSPPAHVPDMSQLLERKHLSRVELLL